VALGAALVALQEPIGDLGFLLLGGTAEVEAAGRAYFDARIWARRRRSPTSPSSDGSWAARRAAVRW
jgi:hypothetical protein